MLRAGLEPATCRCEVDNRICAGPQQVVRRDRDARRTAVSKPRGLGPSYHEITEPLRPATNRLARIRTRTSEVGARCASSYTTGLDKAGDPDRTGSSGLAEAGGHAAEPRGL